MPMPKSVKIAGTDIPEVQQVSVQIETPVGPRGDYDGRTTAATVTLTRRGRNSPISEMFMKSTNEDGRLNLINGTIVLQSSRLHETYTIELVEAFISGWDFSQPPEDEDMTETITLKVGAMTLAGGGKSVNFKVPEFSKK